MIRSAVLTRAVARSWADGIPTTDGAPRWVSGLLAGVQAALLSFLVVVVPTMAAYVATSADPANAEVGWPRSVAVGAVLWLMGHGAPMLVGGTSVTLVPLGLTLLAAFAATASARRSAHATRSAWLAGVGGYLALVATVTLVLGADGPIGAGPWGLVRLLLGATTVAALGLGAGLVTARTVRTATRPAWVRVPALVRVAGTAGAIAAAAVLALAAGLTAVWVLQGRATTGDVVHALGLDVFGGSLLAVGQLALLPNLVLWALAWLAGPGFRVGQGTLFAPHDVIGAPMPALPLLGALPAEGSAGGPLRWAPLAVALCGALAGWYLHRRLVVTRAWEPALAVVLTGLAAGGLAAVATGLAGGAVGPGRLTEVGASAAAVGLSVAGLVALGSALVALPADRTVRGAVARGARDGRQALAGGGRVAGRPRAGDAGSAEPGASPPGAADDVATAGDVSPAGSAGSGAR